MSELVLLDLQVGWVPVVRRNLQRHALEDLEAGTPDA